jgi:hypothetical protein
MITITKSMVALSALMAAGLVAAVDLSGSRVDDQSAAAQVAQRFPTNSEMFTPVSVGSFAAQKLIEAADGRKGDKLPAADNCPQQDRPHLSPQCLISKDGSPVRKVIRVITVERRLGDNTSELVRVPVTNLAQR